MGLKQDLIQIVENFIQSVVDEQKSLSNGDQTYITEGESALEAIKLIKKL